MDKTKFELGDDKEKTGVYEMTFDINNVSGSSVTYGVSSIVMTEGVSPTYTSHGDTTSTQDGRLLEGATEVTSVTGGQQSGNAVTVGAKQSAKVTVKVTLSDKDKEYLDASFKYGMYVEGFITLDAKSGTEVDMNVPMLAFYGDWTEAPIFDEEYYDTHKDEIDAGIDAEDKLMADAYATRVIGGLYSDYIATLGEYYFQQDPAATQIAASKDHIALSNQLNEGSGSVTLNSIYSIWAGLLRNVKELNISIVEDATGKEIFEKTIYNQMKSWSRGGTVYQSSIDVDFSAIEYRLKNNTRYTVTVESYIDYGEKEDQKNARNVFEFPLYIDFEAPIVTDVTYRTETDRTTKKTKLFADLQVYDNHYAMGVQLGQVTPADPGSGYTFEMGTFGKYVTPVYSSFNATSTVTIELTDYVAQI
jgi:lactocepin